MSTGDKTQWNKEYIENIRQRLEEDATAREQREMRRRRALMEQLQAHEAQQVITTFYFEVMVYESFFYLKYLGFYKVNMRGFYIIFKEKCLQG